jgi:hypothetical protein
VTGRLGDGRVPAPRRRAVLTALTAVAASGAAAGCAAPPSDRIGQALAMPSASPSASGPPSAAAGRLVDGFPAVVVPIPPDARITGSAVQPRPDRPDLLGVSATGTSRLSPRNLLGFFHVRLRRAGFTATDDSLLPPGASGAAFGRAPGELLLVAVVDRGPDRSWSIGGTVAR